MRLSKVIVLLREKNSLMKIVLLILVIRLNLREFESFATANSDGIFKINLHGNITFWADNASNLFGC